MTEEKKKRRKAGRTKKKVADLVDEQTLEAFLAQQTPEALRALLDEVDGREVEIRDELEEVLGKQPVVDDG